MKKTLVVAFAVALTLIAVPALALPTLTGSVELEGDWYKEAGDPGQVGYLENQLNLNLGLDAKNRVGVEMRLDGLAQGLFGPEETLLAGVDLTQFQRAYFQNQGRLWKNGPEVTTTIGGLRFNYSPYVAWIGQNDKAEGISVDGIEFGPLNTSAFYLFNGIKGGHVEANLDQINVGGTVVEADDQLAVELTGKIVPIAGAEVTGTFATADEQSAIALEGSMQLTPELKVLGGYHSVDAEFFPVLVNREVDRLNSGNNPVARYWNKAGFTVGAETKVKDIRLSANVDRYTRKNDPDVQENALRLGAAKTIDLLGNPIDTSYELKVPAAGELEHTVGASYQAPNGFAVQAKFLNNEDQSQETEFLGRVGMNFAF